MLEVRNASVYFGEVCALQGVSLTVPRGKTVCVIGANGAGKSTLLNLVAGLIRSRSGGINLEGFPITGLPPHRIASLGISLVPEGRRPFGPLKVIDNLLLGAYTRMPRLRSQELRADMEMVYGLFPALRERERQVASSLSGGEQQMLAIGRALMARPKLLMIDEPSTGLAPQLVRQIFRTLRLLEEEGMTILLVEQNARAALRLAHYCYLLEAGRVVLEGPGPELENHDKVKEAYLGG